MSKPARAVVFDIQNRQRHVRIDLNAIRRMAELAIPYCVEAGKAGGKRKKLPEMLEASIVSDRAIAAVHRDFMNLPDPTDVITFPYGEIIASAETAARNAKIYGQTVEEELTLYLIHGVLHLLGFDDHERAQAAGMRREQEKILKAVRREMC